MDEGPDLARHGVVRWRCADLVKRIKTMFDIDLQKRAVGRLLKKLGNSRLSGRPLHPQSDPEAQKFLNKAFATLARAAIPQELAGCPVEVLFQDEARVGQHGTLTRLGQMRVASARSARPPLHLRLSVRSRLSARGTGAAVVMPYVGVDAMNHRLIEISATVNPCAVALLIIGGEGWPRSNQLVVPYKLSKLSPQCSRAKLDR